MKKLFNRKLKSKEEREIIFPIIKEYVKNYGADAQHEVVLEKEYIQVRPVGGCDTLYCLSDVVDICKAFYMSYYITVDKNLPVINIF